MSLNIYTFVFFLLSGFIGVSIVGWFVANHLDKKYDTDHKQI